MFSSASWLLKPMSQAMSNGTSSVGPRLILRIGIRALGSASTVKSVSARITSASTTTNSLGVRPSFSGTRQHKSMSASVSTARART